MSNVFYQEIFEQKGKHAPEINLLLYCARTHLDPRVEAAIQDLLQRPLDWPFLIETAICHGVAGLLYQNLQKVGSTRVPDAVLKQLLLYFQQTTLESMKLTKALLQVQSLFAEQAIPVIPFKGTLLSTVLYRNLGVRKTSDLDLLVPPQYFQQAIDLLMRSGYTAKRDWTFLDPNREAAYINAWHEYSLINGAINIDLHQALTPDYFLSKEPSFEQLWQNRQPTPLADQPVWSFGSEDLLIYLTIHGSKECWRALKWICDIAEFVQTYPETNWSRVITKAQALGSERMLLIGFRLAQMLLSLTVPPEIQHRIAADSVSIAISNELALNLFSPDSQLSNDFSLRKTGLHFRMMQTMGDRLNCLNYLKEPIRRTLTIFFPNNRDGDFLSLPLRFHFLYYLLRPFRLILTRWPSFKGSWEKLFLS